jgi:outer membrane lipoprotein-sorting protein
MTFSMALRTPVRIATAAALVCAMLAPGAAVAGPFDFLFGGSSPEPTAPVPERADPPRGPTSAQAERPSGMPVSAILPPRRPAALAAPQDVAAAPDASEPTQAPARPVPQPLVTAATASSAPAAAAPAAPLSERAIVERANAYLNGLSSLVANFVQIGGDGRRLTGTLYVQRPGKLRFEYDAPATIEIIADGTSVAVRDRKLVTQDLYSVSQTPLKFLLRDRVELGRDIKVLAAGADPEGVRVSLEDASTLGGTSKITLFFDAAVETMTKWRIVDPQGFQTTVSLSNLDRGRRVDSKLFVINYERMISTQN